jgi:tetratricopeptide (TPR) repeat protein/predicted Ser/Thr protein kinase
MAHLPDDELTQHAAGTLDGQLRADVDAHLAGCQTCLVRYEEIAAFVNSKTYQAPISTVPPPGKDTRPDAPGAQGDEPRKPLHQGTPLGRYVLLERLGAGGMGEVFAAYDPQLDRKVALKLLRSGSLSASEGRARLLREAQAMARLQHPNVVAVHDVGTFEDRVFVAMEFIDGETVGQWTRANHPWREVLRMFVEAGHGLAAAHRAGIVHRDFKPDNVLIGSDRRPRVLDFGLARQASSSTDKTEKLEPDAPRRTRDDVITKESAPIGTSPLNSPLTRDGAVMGTPGYMAPEQLAGLPTDARSDQFSFCVALYEALYGKRPFGGATLKAHANEIAENKLPPPPAGNETPEHIYLALKRGLAADPAQRFADMDALLKALSPIAAVRGRRTLAAIVGLAVVAAFGVSFSLWSARRLRVCAGAERQLNGVWDQTTKVALKAAFTDTKTSFAADAWRGVESALDAYAQAWVAAEKDSCEAVRIRKTDSEDLYQRKMICLDARLQRLKSLVSLLETADAEVVANAVKAARGLDRVDDCRDAVALSQHGDPKDAAEREREEALRRGVIQARTLFDAGKYARGVEAAKAAVMGGGSPRGLADAYLVLGRLQLRAGDNKGAEDSFLEAAVKAEAAGDPALSARAYSRLYDIMGSVESRFDAAHPWERLARAAYERLGQDPDVEAELASNSGDVALAEGRYKDAKKEFEKALRIREATLSEGHPEVSMSLNNLGAAQAYLHEFDEAAKSYERALALDLKYEGPEHPQTASSMNNVAVIYRKQNRLSDALTYFERSLKIRVATLGPDHQDVATSHVTLARHLLRMDKPDDALAHYEEALRIREKVFGKESAQVALVHGELSDFYSERQAFKEALAEAQAALTIDLAALGAAHLQTATAHQRVGETLVHLGQWDKAAQELKLALDVRAQKAGPESVEVALSYEKLGALMLAEGHADKALPMYEKSLAIRERAQGETHPLLAGALIGIGRAQLMMKDAEKAVAPLERAVALRERGDETSELGAIARFELARALWDTSPESHERCKTLATQAREAVSAPMRVEVEKWLASRGP